MIVIKFKNKNAPKRKPIQMYEYCIHKRVTPPTRPTQQVYSTKLEAYLQIINRIDYANAPNKSQAY